MAVKDGGDGSGNCNTSSSINCSSMTETLVSKQQMQVVLSPPTSLSGLCQKVLHTLGEGLPPQLILLRMPSQTHPETCLLVDSGANQLNIQGHPSSICTEVLILL